ncbi:MAG: cupin domain-containing protein [Elusimicrobiota bacterium]
MEHKIIKLKELTKYQKLNIVSNTIINKKKGTITLFAFDKDQSLSPHTSPYDAFVYIVDGEAEISISSKLYKLKKGDFIIMPANKPHSVKATKKLKLLLVMIK